MKAERAGPLVSATARTIIAARLGAGVALFGLLVAACFRPGIADDYRHGYVEVYNRTLTAITFKFTSVAGRCCGASGRWTGSSVRA